MLTILHPDLMPLVADMLIGVLPMKLPGQERQVLVVKVPKEYILAAKVNGSFRIYLAPLLVDGQRTCAAISAFFDDEDEPLVLKTPLDKEFAGSLFDALRDGTVDVHFFDELSRERLVYNATVSIPDRTRELMNGAKLLELSNPRVRAMIDQMDMWFGLRTAEDDAQAIDVVLGKSVYGDDLFIQDLRPIHHSYHGSRGFSHTILERQEPGSYQEEDIVRCLQMVFPSDQIYFSPRRTHDKEEICDILVVTPTRLLIVQAKDTPNTETISRQKLLRKRANVLHALNKAIAQVKGAIGYCRKFQGDLQLLIGGEPRVVNISNLEPKSLIVVKELFDDQFNEYSQPLLGVVEGKGLHCVALDYPEFYMYCRHLRDEDGFFEAYDLVMKFALERREYPRLRFGLSDAAS